MKMKKPENEFKKGDIVEVSCIGHRMDGRIGKIIEYGRFMGTWSVNIDGDTFGLFSGELIKQEG